MHNGTADSAYVRRDLGIAGSDGFIVGVGVTVIVGAAVAGYFIYAANDDLTTGVDAVAGPIAFGLLIAVPGILALLALLDRPALLLPAAVVLIPLSFLSLAGVLLPLLIPAAMLFVAYGRRSGTMSTPGWRVLVATVVVLGLLIAAIAVLFLNEDPRSTTTATGSHYTSDIITTFEMLLSAGLVMSAIGIGWSLATPRRFVGRDDNERTTSSA